MSQFIILQMRSFSSFVNHARRLNCNLERLSVLPSTVPVLHTYCRPSRSIRKALTEI